MVDYVPVTDLQAGLETIRQSPKELGTLDLIVVRPENESRLTPESVELTPEVGLVGDNWLTRGSSSTPDGRANIEAQVAIMNTRVIDLIAQDRERWALAGDQLYVDLDLSRDNLRPGDQLVIGSTILEITPMPHTGCKKFTERFGMEAIKWANSEEGKALRLRGVYAKVIQPGTVQVGDQVVVRR